MKHISNFTHLVVIYLCIASGHVASAQTPDFGYGIGFFNKLGSLVGKSVPVLVAIALLLFIWGLVVFISQSGNEQAVQEGKRKMIWGIITLFVIVSVWGLVALLGQITGIDDGLGFSALEVPQ